MDVCTLDDYFYTTENKFAKIDVLKIDTEGADTWVLYGAEKLLKNKMINHIFFEHNTERMNLLNIMPDEAGKFLQNLGYIVQQQSPTDLYAYPK